jgi:hypothetical protein
MTGGAFGGELGTVGLFDLGQLLQLNRATGRLLVTRDESRGSLYFEDGRIVNAVDDGEREGELAAYRVFTWRTGRFEFHPGSTGVATRITEGTEGLMLEAARRMDESSEAAAEAGAGAGESMEARLRDHRSTMEKLRDVFHHVAREARTAGLTDEMLFSGLSEPGDRLALRAGDPVRRFEGGQWVAGGAMALGAAEYVELRARLIEGTAPGEPPQHRRIVALADGRAIGVHAVQSEEGETLWVRPLRLEPSPLEAWKGPYEALRVLLDLPHGTLLVGARRAHEADRMLHAMIAATLARRAGTIVVVQDEPVFRHVAGHGVVVTTPHAHAGEMVRALQPDVVAFEAGRAPHAAVWSVLHGVPVVMAALVADGATSLAPRWLSSAGAATAQAKLLLRAAPLGLVMAADASFTARLVRPAARPERGTDAAPRLEQPPRAA